MVKKRCQLVINRAFFINISVLFFFFSMNAYELFVDPFQGLIRKSVQLLILFSAILFCSKKISVKMILMIFVCFVTGYLNYKYVGNSMLSNQIIVLIYILGSLLLTDSSLNENVVKFAIYTNVAIICYRFLIVGFFNRVYNVASNNYISVYLLLPAVIYYTMLERKQKDLELHTAIIVWIMCLLGMGRGGILCSSLLLAGLMYIKYKSMKLDTKILILGLIIIVIVAIVPLLWTVIINMSDVAIFSKFSKNGFESHSREQIWNDYFKQATKNKKNLLIGGDNSKTIAAYLFNGNTHNTYLNIHVYNGIFPLILIVTFLVKNIINAIKSKSWVYCLCLLVIILRGYTDVIFWLNLGTPVLFYLVFYKFDIKDEPSKKIEKLSDNSIRNKRLITFKL